MARRKRHESTALASRIKGYHDEGMTPTQISEIIGITADSVRQYIDGVIGGIYKKPDVNTIVALSAAGHSRRTIAKMLNTNPSTVHMILANHSLDNSEKGNK